MNKPVLKCDRVGLYTCGKLHLIFLS